MKNLMNGLVAFCGVGSHIIRKRVVWRSIPCVRRIREREVLPVWYVVQLGGANHVVVMSKSIVEHTRIIVTESALQGWERLIVKLDRHK